MLAVAFVSYIYINIDLANGLLSGGDPAIEQALSRSGYDITPGAQSA